MTQESGPIMQFQKMLKKHEETTAMLFDPVRKKWIIETSEEMVRQCLILYLNSSYSIPLNRMAVEKQIEINELKKRFDLVVYNKSGKPYILIECKANHLKMHQSMFDQASTYNLKLEAPFLGICNGEHLIICKMDFVNRKYEYIKDLPHYPF